MYCDAFECWRRDGDVDFKVALETFANERIGPRSVPFPLPSPPHSIFKAPKSRMIHRGWRHVMASFKQLVSTLSYNWFRQVDNRARLPWISTQHGARFCAKPVILQLLLQADPGLSTPPSWFSPASCRGVWQRYFSPRYSLSSRRIKW